MKRSRSFSILLFLLVLALVSTTSASNFPDTKDHWAEERIEKLVGIGAISGYPDGTFRPDDTITRAEFCSVLGGALDVEKAEGVTFPDIEGHWGQERVEGLIEEGLIDTELYDEEYGPDENITREEIAMMLALAINDAEVNDIPFDDANEITPGFEHYVALVFDEEIITGYPDNTFRPSGTATRAEASTMTVRALEVLGIIEEVEEPEEMALHFIDVGQGDALLIETACMCWLTEGLAAQVMK